MLLGQKRAAECTKVNLLSQVHGAIACTLIACDVHGNGRSNKAWMGKLGETDIDLPNLKAVKAFAKARGLRVHKMTE